MSHHLDFAEVSRQARRIVDANRAQSILEHTASTSTGQGKIKYTRTTTGCTPCRSKKVKCDETIPACLRCVASQTVCVYPLPKAAGTRGTKRKSVGGRESVPAELNGEPAGTTRLRLEDDLRRTTAGPVDSAMLVTPRSASRLDIAEGEVRRKDRFASSQSSRIALGDASISPQTDMTGLGVSPDMGSAVQHIATTDFSFLDEFIPFVGPTSKPSSSTGVHRASSMSQPYQPHIGDLNKSLLINRRLLKHAHNSQEQSKERTPSAPPPPPHPRLQLVESILFAYDTDETLFEFGPSHRDHNLSNNSLTFGIVDVLSNAFPSPTSRMLFHHYCNIASRILVTMGNIGPNPLLAFCTPDRLLDTNSAASAAVRMSMLSTGVAHFTHETSDAVGPAELGVGWEGQRKKLKELGNKFKRAALANITLAAKVETGDEQLDSILAACTLVCIRDVISADSSWRDNLEFALSLISKKGGPQAMLQGPGYSFTRRYLLENLATHDVFSSFVTGKEPSLLGNSDSWWFDSVETSQTRWEWESVERSFGISRAMVDLMARIVSVDSQKRRLGVSLSHQTREMWEVTQHFEREAHCLLLELDIWGNSLNALPQNARVTCGDYIYKYAGVVFLLADVLEKPPTTPRIVNSINYILELLSEASAMRMAVMLVWPLLIAGVFCGKDVRQKVGELFDAFQSDYCEDLQVARELLEEQWRCIDTGKGKQRWSTIMEKLGRYVLLI